jgi:hypothetical protein
VPGYIFCVERLLYGFLYISHYAPNHATAGTSRFDFSIPVSIHRIASLELAFYEFSIIGLSLEIVIKKKSINPDGAFADGAAITSSVCTDRNENIKQMYHSLSADPFVSGDLMFVPFVIMIPVVAV